MAQHAHREPARKTPPTGDTPKRKPARSRSRSLARKLGRGASKTGLWIGGSLLGLFLLLLLASFFWDEPLRRKMERQMNESLKGYTVTLPRAHFQLFGLGVDLKDLTVRQQAHPEPPVALFPRLHASLQWRELFTGHLVADFLLDHPKIYLNLPQLQKEISDPTPVKDKGWQQALQKIYPFKINLLRINEGEITYIDEDPKRPLRISHLSIHADNIRNIHSKEHVYSSPIHAEGIIFETGRGALDGHADFLSEPYPGFHAMLRLAKVPIDYFRPMVARANLSIRGGVLDTSGELEFSPKTKFVHLKDVTVSDMRLDYIHTLPTAVAESARREKVKEAASKTANKPGLLLKLDQLDLTRCDIGLVNKAKNPAYRAFLAPVNVTVTNLSNHFTEGPAHAKLQGKFMGSGVTKATARFRPDANGPDFDLNASIEHTDLTKMNDILRAYGKFDVVAGDFSFFTELHIKNGQITGYVKPLFENMKVYDKRQDADKTFFRKLYEKLVGGVAKLLENKNTDKVATKAEIQGRVGDAKASTWQVIGSLIENAFFRAILPGFDEALGLQKKK
jgi:Domain of Unknown Function (DUF748)